MQEPNDIEQDPIASLLRRAGRRPQPPGEVVARIRAQVHAEWAAGVRRRRRRRWMALAASVGVLALVAFLALGLPKRQQPVIVAQTEAGARSIVLGEQIDAAPGQGLVLHAQAGGATVRIAGGSSVRFEAPEQLRLLAGSLYVDTGDTAVSGAAEAVNPRLVVLADRVSIEHVGTQFLVRMTMTGARVDVAVRSGSVVMRSMEDTATLTRGEMGRIDTSAGAAPGIQRFQVPVSGEQWSWVDDLAPPLVIEGVSLYEALRQLSHEAGFELRFESSQAETAARETVLHGPALRLMPARALQALLATTNLTGEVRSGDSTLMIRMR